MCFWGLDYTPSAVIRLRYFEPLAGAVPHPGYHRVDDVADALLDVVPLSLPWMAVSLCYALAVVGRAAVGPGLILSIDVVCDRTCAPAPVLAGVGDVADATLGANR